MQIKRLKELLLANLYISTFTFGGGFVITTFMRKKFVQELKWIDDEEMLDLVAIAQSCPGSIAVNCAILVGFHVAGPLGVLVSVIGTILPPFIIMLIIYVFYALFSNNLYVSLLLEGIQIAVTAIIFDTVFDLGLKVIETKNIFFYAILIMALLMNIVFKINVVLIILVSLALGIVYGIYKIVGARYI